MPKPLSRFMKPREELQEEPRPLSPAGNVVVVLLILGIVAALVYWIGPMVVEIWQAGPFVVALVILGFLWVPILLLWRAARYSRRLRRLELERSGESICEFVRALPRRSIDPWAVRAVYEEFQHALGSDSLPLRATDRLKEFGLDGVEFDDILELAAKRCCRDLTDTEGNPFYSKVDTLGDLVLWLSAQPSTRDA